MMVSLNIYKNSTNQFGRKIGFKIENDTEEQSQSIAKIMGILTIRVLTGPCESKHRAFQRPFQDQNNYFKDLYGKFCNANMWRYHLSKEACDSQMLRKAHPIEWTEWFFLTLDEK